MRKLTQEELIIFINLLEKEIETYPESNEYLFKLRRLSGTFKLQLESYSRGKFIINKTGELKFIQKKYRVWIKNKDQYCKKSMDAQYVVVEANSIYKARKIAEELNPGCKATGVTLLT